MKKKDIKIKIIKYIQKIRIVLCRRFNIKNKTVMKDEEENEFKTKMENYLKNMDRGDLDIVEAVVKINEVKQALNEKSLFVRLGDFIIEQINIVKNPQITR